MTQLGNIPFPQNPALWEQFSFATRTWVWDGYAWRDASSDLAPDRGIFLPKAGGSMEGPLTVMDNHENSENVVQKAYVDTRDSVLIAYLDNLNARVTALEQDSSQVSFFALIDDGSETIQPGELVPLVIFSVTGTGVSLDNDGIQFTTVNDVYVEVRGELLQNWGVTVEAFYQWDDEEPVGMGGVQIESNDFMYAFRSATITERIGSTLRLWITSDFEFAPTQWRNVNLIGFST